MSAVPGRQHSKPESIRFVLRSATRAEHAALDGHPAFAALTSVAPDIDAYRRLMARFFGFYLPHDDMLAQACRTHSLDRLGYSYHPRAKMLASDLRDLGVAPLVRMTTPLPGGLAPIESAGALAGVLYVIEGSLLGGSVLCRAAESLLHRHESGGWSYWRWCRDAGARRWAMTCAMLEGLAQDDAVRADMIDGARAAFLAFGGWIGDLDETAASIGPPARSFEPC